MKRLTKEEFQSRVEAVARARRIFVPGVTNNITYAFEIYQEVLAEEDRKLRLETERARDYGLFAELERPLCKVCGKEMGLRLIKEKKGRENREGWKSCWLCEWCLYEEYSLNELSDWIKVLKKKEEGEDGLSG